MKTPGVPAWVIAISAPLALASSTSPLVLLDAIISPIDALLSLNEIKKKLKS